MKFRNLILGGTVATIGAMGISLAVISSENSQRTKLIDDKKKELSEALYPVVPSESRILSSPAGPALPSPGYEN